MKTFLVVNPQSSNGQTGKRWAEISAHVQRRLGDCGCAFTEKPMDAERLARRALEEGYGCIVAVGGDGTVNEVVNGFFHQGRALNPAAALGLIPRGTGGDFRKTFGWAGEVGQAVDRLRSERVQPFDVGLLEYTGEDGQRRQRYFANISSFGVSGQVAQRVNQGSKALGGKLAFKLASFRALAGYRDQAISLSIDGGPAEALSVTALAVANGKYFGGGMMVAPGAETSDGLFDVTIWSGYTLWDFALKSKGAYSGEHIHWKGTRTLRARRVEANSKEEVLIDCDGEQAGRLPCAMTLLPGAIRLKV